MATFVKLTRFTPNEKDSVFVWVNMETVAIMQAYSGYTRLDISNDYVNVVETPEQIMALLAPATAPGVTDSEEE